jgi:endonuclease/exonuclease/phosphatase family metal-dependent hydrolase
VTDSLRIMTWNVHGTFNLNPDFDLDGVSAIIEKWSPDVVALQEVDSRGRTDDPFARLADVVGQHRAEARSIVTKDGDYGQLLISKLKFAAPSVITDVSYQEREPRRAITARICSPLGEVTVVATHLGLSIYERHAQARAIAELVDNTCTVVVGDFNDWLWVKSVRRVLAGRCPVRTRLRTFPSGLPILRLDRIYTTADGEILKAWTDQDAKAYSDHLPVIADIAFSGVTASGGQKNKTDGGTVSLPSASQASSAACSRST